MELPRQLEDQSQKHPFDAWTEEQIRTRNLATLSGNAGKKFKTISPGRPTDAAYEDFFRETGGQASSRGMVSHSCIDMKYFEQMNMNAAEAPSLMLGGGGKLLAMMDAKETQWMACGMLKLATGQVVLTAFTFDQEAVCDALRAAAQRGVPTMLIADKVHSLKGTTQKMPDRLNELLASGVKVRFTAGTSGQSGIQHSKTLLCDDVLLVGSTNWTKASRSNHEVGLLIRLNDEGLEKYTEQTAKILQTSRSMLEADCKVGQAVRSNRRARSAEPKRLPQDGFAKRHSVMIARKTQQAELLHRLAMGPEESTAAAAAGAYNDEDYTSEPECASRK